MLTQDPRDWLCNAMGIRTAMLGGRVDATETTECNTQHASAVRSIPRTCANMVVLCKTY